MYNRRYDKAFVMLKQETNGFSLGNKPAWGSVSMEIKNGVGRISLSLQEMKPLPAGRDYVLYVIGGEKGLIEGICCGKVAIDHYGRGELKWEFNPDDVGGSKQTAEHLHTVAVLVEGKENYGLIVPVAGYFGDTVNWKKRFTIFEQNPKPSAIKAEKQPEKIMITEVKPKEVEQQPAEEIVIEETKIDEAVAEETVAEESIVLEAAANETDIEEIAVLETKEEVVEKEEIIPSQQENTPSLEKEMVACETATVVPELDKSDFHKNFKDMMVRFQKELNDLEKSGIIKPEDRKRIDAAGNSKKMELNEMEQQLSYICTYNTPIMPFEGDERLWRCISMEELVILPVDYLAMMRNSFYILPYRKYKHFIFGWDKKGACYLGIPDSYKAQNRRLAENLGFQNFEPCENKEVMEQCMGYWLKEISR